MPGDMIALQLFAIWLFGIQWICGVSFADDSMAAISAANSSSAMAMVTPSPSVNPGVLLWSALHPVQYYQFDPNSVDSATRSQWCSIQTSSCGNRRSCQSRIACQGNAHLSLSRQRRPSISAKHMRSSDSRLRLHLRGRKYAKSREWVKSANEIGS